jgi:hypothetical protein
MAIICAVHKSGIKDAKHRAGNIAKPQVLLRRW